MDRRSWPWRKSSSVKSPANTESSGSASPQSERFSDDQELRSSPNNSSSISVKTYTNHAQSPDVSSNTGESQDHETVKSLTEKLSAALLSISTKEDLVKQHSKVAEEAVSGWEKAENDLAVLKQQFEATTQKNSALEDRTSHLDGALKECVRQLRQSREEQEQKVQDAVKKKTQEWEFSRSELENQLAELKNQLEASKAEAATTDNLQSKLEVLENDNDALKVELFTLSEELKIRILERELSTQTAEAASKQHLESIKKLAKLEAECRKLKAVARKKSTVNDHKIVSSSACVESLTDSQSDSGDRLLVLDNEASCSDSWASALIAELDQFKNEKAGSKTLNSSVDIDLMDDFLEMEKLAALPESDQISSSVALEANSARVIMREHSSMVEFEAMERKLSELEDKVEKMESEKAKLEMALADTQRQLEISCGQLTLAEDKLVQLWHEVELSNELKQTALVEVESVEAEKKALKSQLESTLLEVGKLKEKIVSLEVEGSASFSALQTRLERSEAKREAVEAQLQSARTEVEKLRENVRQLEGRIEEERALAAEFQAEVKSLEATRQAVESRFLSANVEARKLQEKVKLLEERLEHERSLTSEFVPKVKALKDEKKALEFELELANSEAQKLSNKVGLLEAEVESERAVKDLFAVKCQNLESELLKKSREAEGRVVAISNGELTVKQEKELAVAAEKLTECQKTIASLGRQLKSLATLDEFVIESDKLGFNEDCSANGKQWGYPPSPKSPTSSLSGFENFLSRSISNHTENQ